MKTTTNIIISTICATFLLLSSSSSVNAASGTACSMDYPCGAPYGQCAGSVNDCTTTFGGVAIDEYRGDVYYSTSCRSSGDSYNITIKKVSANGGVPSTFYSEAPLQEGGNVAKVFTVVNGVLYVQRVERQPGSNLYTFNYINGEQRTVQLTPGFFQAQLDIANGASYSCQLNYGANNNYTIQRFVGVVGQTSSNSGIRLYSLGSTPCGPLRRATGNDIIFTGLTYKVTGQNQQQTVTTTTTFYKGSVVGNTTLPPVYFSVDELVNDFDVDTSTGAIIYGTATGLFSRVGTKTTTLNNEQVIGVAIFNNKIYYNNGFTIRSVNKDGSNVQQVVQPSAGKCTCRPRFTGDNCQSCSGQVQWEGGVPSCVAVNAAGVPATCTADYQCGNVPYSVCSSGSCKCRDNFTGDKCDQCSPPKFLSFVNGIPYCS